MRVAVGTRRDAEAGPELADDENRRDRVVGGLCRGYGQQPSVLLASLASVRTMSRRSSDQVGCAAQVRTAVMTTCATSLGWEIMTTCEAPSISVTVAPMRL